MLVPRTSLPAGMIAVALAVAATPAGAADYYAGRTVDLVVGNYPGGGYDIYARTLARHLGRNIPGNPTIVVKNMPGAGSAKAGHHISVIAPKDGLSIGAVTSGSIVAPLLDEKPDTMFDPTKVTYLGTANSGSRVCLTLAQSKTRTFDDAMAQKTIVGGVAAGDAVQDYAYLLKRVTGAAFEIVSGYKGTLDIFLAIERGEIDGMCGLDWSSLKSLKPDWIRDRKINLLVQVGPEPNAELTAMGVPQIWNYVRQDNRNVVELVVGQQAFMRPYFVAMGTPAEQINILRSAFDATMRDPRFQADAEKMHIDLAPKPGSMVQELVTKLYAASKDVVERARAAIRP